MTGCCLEDKAFSGIISRRVRRVALSMIEKEGNILDVGCGNGIFISMMMEGAGDLLSPKAFEIFGLDRSEGLILKTRDRLKGHRVHLIRADFFHLPFRDSSFHRVTFLNTIMNLYDEDLHILLQEVRRVLKGDGRAYIEFRNTGNPYLRWKYRRAMESGFFVRGFDLKGFRDFIGREGFKVLRLRPVTLLPLPFALSYVVEVKKD